MEELEDKNEKVEVKEKKTSRRIRTHEIDDEVIQSNNQVITVDVVEIEETVPEKEFEDIKNVSEKIYQLQMQLKRPVNQVRKKPSNLNFKIPKVSKKFY